MPDNPDDFQPSVMSCIQSFVFLFALATTSYAVVRLFELVFTS